jgi:hypothetical protein
LYAAVYIPDGKKNIAALLTEPNSVHFVNEAYKHCKAIATGADGVAFLKGTFVKEIESKNLNMEEAGVITDGNADKFIGCIAIIVSGIVKNRERCRLNIIWSDTSYSVTNLINSVLNFWVSSRNRL